MKTDISKFLYLIIIVAVIALLYIGYGAGNQRDQETIKAVDNIDMKELAKHDNIQNCWLLIDGKVYDVTNFISTHPGGLAIVQGCGMDATELFETRPMGSGEPHSERARMMSDDYYIGIIENS